ncbi:MAG: phosphatidate cytidylyltransferase [Candidatus Glassbacteria bacterium]
MERSLPADNNLSIRVYSAFVFVPLFLIVTFIGGIVFTLLIEALILLGLAELYGILESGGLRPMKVSGYLLATGVCIFASGFSNRPSLIIAGFTVTILIALAFFTIGVILGRSPDSSLATIGGVIYVGWLFSLQIPLRDVAQGLQFTMASMTTDTLGWLLLIFGYAMVWTCDTSAYFVGKKFGRHRLIPSVSPGKTVEGAIGGFLSTVLVAFLFRGLFLPGFSTGLTAVLGITAGLVSQLGDIFESMLKRMGNVKDSSRIIPGHGGILDRFDGMLFALPAIYYILLAEAHF